MPIDVGSKAVRGPAGIHGTLRSSLAGRYRFGTPSPLASTTIGLGSRENRVVYMEKESANLGFVVTLRGTRRGKPRSV